MQTYNRFTTVVTITATGATAIAVATALRATTMDMGMAMAQESIFTSAAAMVFTADTVLDTASTAVMVDTMVTERV